jgi:hypothetical protein
MLVTLDGAPVGAPCILGRHDLLVTALRALLETAVKFSEPGGVVRLTYPSAPGENSNCDGDQRAHRAGSRDPRVLRSLRHR